MNGVYVMLYPSEKYTLKPGDQFRLGDLEFRLERYNTGVSEYAKLPEDLTTDIKLFMISALMNT